MKKIALILILISFSARPLYQLSYFAYYELNIDYITAKYCVNKDKPEMQCNGKCHLMKELAMGAPKKDNARSLQLIEAFYPVYFQEYAYTYSFPFLEPRECSNWSICNDQQTRFLNVPVPPPKV